MLDLLWIVPAFPILGFLTLVLTGSRLSHKGQSLVGVGSVGASAALSLAIAISFITAPPTDYHYGETLWNWITIGNFSPTIGFHLDALSICMMLVVTVVGFLIHLYSVGYMAGDDGFRRFFAYMNLFIASMLTLVLADNLLMLYLGWEGVGLCSFLLIGFWYKEPENVKAATKAFVITRIGDTSMVIGLFLLFNSLGTLQIQELTVRATQQWAVGSTMPVLAAALLLGGALGKSAQLPLQTWLPDAMAGPTPVSALIHAATMVTAGVYLIARMNVLFTLAPVVQSAVAIVGLVTLLLAGFSALAQTDIKRVLAYSTISQIGYMFLALGVGAWSAAIFHFVTHAFFKALLFLAAGSIILAAGHEQNMFKLGGVRKKLPVTFWTFLIGAASLAALPLVTDGFYSKDMILWDVWSSAIGGPWLWAGAMAGALLTSLYTFRMVFLTCFGAPRTTLTSHPRNSMRIPLITLAILSVVVGFIELPHNFANVHLFSDFLNTALPLFAANSANLHGALALEIIAGLVCVVGVPVCYLLYLKSPDYSEKLVKSPLFMGLHRLWFSGWGFDLIYDKLVVRPFIWITDINKMDFVDNFYGFVATITQVLHRVLSLTQTGKLRQYALGITFGAILILGILACL
ncbi:MAG: NADH-quinone oxidoreductase subunit L [Desulfomonilaceae bacterium]